MLLRLIALLLALPFFALTAFSQVAPKADPKKPEPGKDSVKKLTDGWYAVEFQVGAARVKAEFPGEPKLDSADGEKTYSFTMAKENRKFFVRVTDGYDGKIISEDKGDVGHAIAKKWKETEPRYKDAIILTGKLNGLPGVRVNVEGSKTRVGGESWAVVSQGCFIHAGIDNYTSDKAHKRFFETIKAEKGEATATESTAIDVPKDWIEHTKGKLQIKVYAPLQLASGANVSGEYGDYTFFIKDGKTNEFEVRISYQTDDKGYQGVKNNINAMVPNRAAKVTVASVPGISTFKGGKPVAKDGKYEFYAFVGNYALQVKCKSDKVSPEDAEKIAAIVLQQMKK